MLAGVRLKLLSYVVELACVSQTHRRFSTVVVRLLRKLKVLSSILRAGMPVYCIGPLLLLQSYCTYQFGLYMRHPFGSQATSFTSILYATFDEHVHTIVYYHAVFNN